MYVLREIMLKNKNNFEIIHSGFQCEAENFSDHPRMSMNTLKFNTGHSQMEEQKHFCLTY